MLVGTSQPYLWLPGQPVYHAALDRMAQAFPKPDQPMGESWFMGERRFFPELGYDLATVADNDILHAFEELLSGPSSFGHQDEWTDWYHYLLPYLLERPWRHTHAVAAEMLLTGFMIQRRSLADGAPYPQWPDDVMATLGCHIMTPRFWQDGCIDIGEALSIDADRPGGLGWYHAGGFLSASLFFCIRYLPPSAVEPWFASVLAIDDGHWRIQLLTWLVGAYSMLSGEITQPRQLPDHGPFSAGWGESYRVSGYYSGDPTTWEVRGLVEDFLPVANRATIMGMARSIDAKPFFDDVWTDPQMEPVVAEIAGLPERFYQLYRDV